MNKMLLGMLNTMLLDPDPDQAQNFYSGAVAPVTEKPVAPGNAGDGAEVGEGAENFSDAGEVAGEGVENFGDANAGEVAEGEEAPTSEDAEGEEVAPAAGTAPKSNVVKLDDETIAAIRAAQQPQGGQQQANEGAGEAPRMSKEELNKLLNPVVVTSQTLAAMGIENASPEQVQGFQQFATATVKNAVSIARLIIQQEKEQFEAALGPIFQEREQGRVEAARQDFFKSYKSLQPYDKIVKLAAAEVMQEAGADTKMTKDQVYKAVAAKTISTLQSLGVKINQQTPAANLSAGQRTVPKPNGHAALGRSGGGQGTSTKTNNPDADIYKR